MCCHTIIIPLLIIWMLTLIPMVWFYKKGKFLIYEDNDELRIELKLPGSVQKVLFWCLRKLNKCHEYKGE